MASDTKPLRDLRVLIVEDSFLVAVDACAHLESCGCKVVGPVACLTTALDLARREPLDGVLLDVNLDGELSFPVAAALDARNVPYVFLTGYDADDIFPREYRDAPRLAKPFEHHHLVRTLTEHFRKGRRFRTADAMLC